MTIAETLESNVKVCMYVHEGGREEGREGGTFLHELMQESSLAFVALYLCLSFSFVYYCK